MIGADLHPRAVVEQTPSPPSPTLPVQDAAAKLNEAQLAVFRLLVESTQPLTAGQIARALLLPTSRVRTVTGDLCRCGIVSRLNTLIESYIVAGSSQANAADANVG